MVLFSEQHGSAAHTALLLDPPRSHRCRCGAGPASPPPPAAPGWTAPSPPHGGAPALAPPAPSPTGGAGCGRARAAPAPPSPPYSARWPSPRLQHGAGQGGAGALRPASCLECTHPRSPAHDWADHTRWRMRRTARLHRHNTCSVGTASTTSGQAAMTSGDQLRGGGPAQVGDSPDMASSSVTLIASPRCTQPSAGKRALTRQSPPPCRGQVTHPTCPARCPPQTG